MNRTRTIVALITTALTIISLRFISFPRSDKVLDGASRDHATFTGIIIDDPAANNISAKFTMSVGKINGVKIEGRHKLLVKTDNSTVQYGDEIEISTKLKKPERIENEDGRTFDYAAYLMKDKIFYTATAVGKNKKTGESNLRILANDRGNIIFSALYNFKRSFIEHINRILPSPHAFLASGLIISGKGSLSKELQNQFQRVGLIHIVVLSGFNISIIGEAITRIFSFLPATFGAICGGAGIILFSIMTGGGSTVIRSAIMSIIGLYARISGRINSALTSLLAAGLLMLIWNPMLAFYDPSFQLSFAATLGLILYAEPFERLLTPFTKKLRLSQSLLSLISSTLSTQVFTMPLIMRMSGVVSLVALPVNIIVLPCIPLTMFFVFVSGAASFTGPFLASLPAFISYLMLSYELAVVSFASSLPFAAIQLPPVSISVVLISYIILTFVGAKAYMKVINSNTKKPTPEALMHTINTPATAAFQYEKTPP